MELSVFDLFKIGIGPSSSHTVGPMRAARRFVGMLDDEGLLARVARVRCDLYGSLALTGRGHYTDKAVVLGLSGERPEAVDPAQVDSIVGAVRGGAPLQLAGRHGVPWIESQDLRFHTDDVLPLHPNGLRLTALAEDGATLRVQDFYSVGGGFVVTAQEAEAGQAGGSDPAGQVAYPFTSGAELLALGEARRLTIADVVRANERAWRPDEETDRGLDEIWDVMQACIERGCRAEGVLPGGLKIRRRAAQLFRNLQHRTSSEDPLILLDWVSLFALAVNEENAAGGRVVTAPTNGAAGVIPAVLAY
ncbi:MAG: L-serine ammonia-lyase, partial [Gemmatimonadales bacterium]|nr:L-serine ammonia-lyase [Gemmatimonadales bacterium]